MSDVPDSKYKYTENMYLRYGCFVSQGLSFEGEWMPWGTASNNEELAKNKSTNDAWLYL